LPLSLVAQPAIAMTATRHRTPFLCAVRWVIGSLLSNVGGMDPSNHRQCARS
jgi:hypothetical protein